MESVIPRPKAVPVYASRNSTEAIAWVTVDTGSLSCRDIIDGHSRLRALAALHGNRPMAIKFDENGECAYASFDEADRT